MFFEELFGLLNLEHLVQDYLIPWGLNLIIAIVIVFIGWLVLRWADSFLGKMLARFKVKAILVEFVQQVAKALLYVILTILVLSQLGFDTTSLVAILAAGSIAIGLALKDSLQNFASGVMLILQQPFQEGHFVEAAGQMGVVEKVSLFSTVFRATDNRVINIPNGHIYSAAIINYSARDTRRLDLVFGVSYDSDLRKAKSILQDLVANDERVRSEPEPLVVVSELAESSVNFTVRVWVNSHDYWGLRFYLLETVKLTFDEQGIVIPYPQMALHIQNSDQSFEQNSTADMGKN